MYWPYANSNKGKGIEILIEYREEKEITTKKVIINILCNCCGESIKKLRDADFSAHYSHVTLNTDWGYFSEGFFLDGEKHKLHVCEKCYAKWIKTFAIAPEGFGQCGYYDEDVYEQEEFEKWKDSFHNA